MRFDEISKAQFVDKLGRQWIGNIENRLAKFKKYINTIGWDVEWDVADDAKSISVEVTMVDENTKSTAEWIKRLFWDYIAETGDDGIVQGEIYGIHETDKILIWNIELQ